MEELEIIEKKQIILDIMSDIDKFCRENKIPYSISSGTLLGAVRHGGFIPWDDDADMFMLREDFDRFIKTYKKRKYQLLYNKEDKNVFFRDGYAKVCDHHTTVVKKDTLARYGVYVDIFPLDYVPGDKKKRETFMNKVMRYHHKLHHRQKNDFISKLISYYHTTDWWWDKCDRVVRNPEYKDSRFVAHILGSRNKRTVLDKIVFENLSEIEFEGRRFLAFSDHHSYLTMVYGDYMTPPPAKDRDGHRSERFYKLPIK